MIDVLIYESGNGGELSLKDGDIETTDSIANQSYLSHFGGNVEKKTSTYKDWWGNTFLPVEAAQVSELERALNENAINSYGLSNIEKAAKKDIEHLTSSAEILTSVELKQNDKVIISHKIDQNNNDIMWDATKNELILEINI